jgi:hypothetical protein
VAHLVNVVIDQGVLLDIRVGRGDIGLGLIIVIITDEKFDGVLRKEFLEFSVELGSQGLVMRNNHGGLLDFLNHIGHGEGLSRTGHSQKNLVWYPFENPFSQCLDRLWLVAFGLVFRNQFEPVHFFILQQREEK